MYQFVFRYYRIASVLKKMLPVLINVLWSKKTIQSHFYCICAHYSINN